MVRWKVAIPGSSVRGCKHYWVLFWDAEPLERQCERCLELQKEIEEDDFF